MWSDQYNVKVHVVGRFRGDDTMQLVYGSFADRTFVALYERAGRVVGALGFNQPRRIVRAQMLIADRASIDDARSVLAG